VVWGGGGGLVLIYSVRPGKCVVPEKSWDFFKYLEIFDAGTFFLFLKAMQTGQSVIFNDTIKNAYSSYHKLSEILPNIQKLKVIFNNYVIKSI
jgi:hypothetical protein